MPPSAEHCVHRNQPRRPHLPPVRRFQTVPPSPLRMSVRTPVDPAAPGPRCAVQASGSVQPAGRSVPRTAARGQRESRSGFPGGRAIPAGSRGSAYLTAAGSGRFGLPPAAVRRRACSWESRRRPPSRNAGRRRGPQSSRSGCCGSTA